MKVFLFVVLIVSAIVAITMGQDADSFPEDAGNLA